MRAKKIDANQPEIVDALRKAGYTVIDTHALGNGFPDLLAVTHNGVNVLIEVKSPGEKLTGKYEPEFHETFPGALGIAYSAEQALEIMRWYEMGYVQREREIPF